MDPPSKFRFTFIILLSCLFIEGEALKSKDVCGDSTWTIYGDTKCLKLLDTTATFAEAGELCMATEGGSLITIQSQDEQDVITKLLVDHHKYFRGSVVWLGAKGLGEKPEFFWEDGSILEPLGSLLWEPETLSSNENSCLQLSVSISEDETRKSNDHELKWMAVSCSKRNRVVCQKTQTWSLGRLQNAFFQQRTELDKKTKEMSSMQKKLEQMAHAYSQLQDNPVPIGFVYVQLPGESEPDRIWPEVTWTQITGEYAGLFFRAEGGNSFEFGQEQNDSSRSITKIRGQAYTNESPYEINLPESGWSDWVSAGRAPSTFPVYHNAMQFYVSEDEVRPTNTAVRIWKRTA